MSVEQCYKGCKRVKGNQKLVTRLWNAIDGMKEPEAFWSILIQECPESFNRIHDANSIRFQY